VTADERDPLLELREAIDARQHLARRLAALAADQPAMDHLAGLAARLLGTASAQVSLISDVQTVVGGIGSSAPSVGVSTPVEESVCSVTVGSSASVLIPDATADPRVQHMEAVRAGVVGAYLGVPLVVRDETVGALCVYDPVPREWTEEDVLLLEQLAASAVTELQLAALAEEYEDERMRWQLAVDAAEVGAFDWNLVTGELRWDERLVELFGLERGAFGGTIEAFNASVHPDDRARVGAALSAAVDACGVFTSEYRIMLPSGGTRWVAARGRALAGSDGGAVRLLGAAYDTTAVQDNEARVARLLEAMPMAFFQLDRDWRFTFLNSEAHRLLGAIGSDIVGGIIWELFPDAVGSDFETHYRAAVDTNEPVEFEAYYPPPLDRWYEIRGWPTPDGLLVYFIDVSERRRAQHAAETAAARASNLAGITASLTGTLDIDVAVAQLAEVVVGPWADWSIVTLVDHSVSQVPGTAHLEGSRHLWRRGLRDVAGWHADPERRGLVDRYLEHRIPDLNDVSFLAEAMREDRAVVVVDGAGDAIASMLRPGAALDAWTQLSASSAAVLPLRGRGRTIGLLTVFRGMDRPPFSDDDMTDLVDVADRAGVALDNVRLYAEQRDLSEGLQRSLLTPPPAPDHLHVVVRYEPAAKAAQVGGDWYDSFLQGSGATNVVIGDVVGHDTVAAAAMGQIRGLLRGIAVTTGAGPAEVLQRLDEAMATLQIETIATAIVARLEQTPDELEAGVTRLRWSNAGHPPPLVVVHPEAPETPETVGEPPRVDPRDVEVTALWPDEADLMLGLVPSGDRTEAVLTLTRGSTVLLYTDGLVERRGELIDRGVDRLRAVVAELTAEGRDLEEVCDELVRRMLPERPEDDVAIVAVRLHPQDRPRPPVASPPRVPPTVD
jgi:GAF domain-containing protein